MPNQKIAVDREALYQLLRALNGPAHLIAELQATRDRGRGLFLDNPIDVLMRELNEAATAAEAFEPAAEVLTTYDLVSHLYRQRAFSERTFGPGARAAGVVDHIRKELAEIAADPTDLTEWVDVVLLALDGAWRAGYKPEEIALALKAKQLKNEARTWPDWRTAEPGKAIEHVRTAEPPECLIRIEPTPLMLDSEFTRKSAESVRQVQLAKSAPELLAVLQMVADTPAGEPLSEALRTVVAVTVSTVKGE